MVQVKDGKLYLFDLGSTGGTKLNGREISGLEIDLNSVLRFGETELSLMGVDDPQQFAPAHTNGVTMIDRRGQRVGVLVVRSGPDAGKSYMLTEGDNLVGRDRDCQVNLSDPTVSRSHAVVRCQGGKLFLFDVGSNPGTYLDGQAMGGFLIRAGDVFSMGRSEITLIRPQE